MNLEFKHLSNYFPYELRILDRYGDLRILKYTDLKNVSDEGNVYGIKPILRPLSDLDKPIYRDVNLTVVPSRAFDLVQDEDGDWCDEFYADQCESPKAKVMVTQMNFWLFEYHFDVFGLIEKGLAISIHDVSQADA